MKLADMNFVTLIIEINNSKRVKIKINCFPFLLIKKK